MKYVYAVSEQSELLRYQAFAAKHDRRLHRFLHFLGETYQVKDLPNAIVWTSARIATKLISNIPLPGYTNEFRTVFCPDAESWRAFYLNQLDEADSAEARRYYETSLTERHVLQILGHEFVHHSDLFLDDAYEKARWFEEGMCEYVSRKYFLTEEEFSEETRLNTLLVKQFEDRHGLQSLEGFCADTYAKSFTDIFFFYWKSFLAINHIVEQFDGDVMAVFLEYHNWFENGSFLPLSDWFHV